MSLWRDTVQMPAFEPLCGDAKTDVLVIGGGMAGLLCAHMLRRCGVDCAVAEAGAVCGGVSAGTTAKITSQHGFIYDRLLRSFGAERTRMYYEANEAALAQYRELCAGMDCGFEEQDAVTYTLRGARRAERELKALGSIGAAAEWARGLPLPFAVDGAVRFRRQAQFHPLRFASHIARGLRVWERTPVRSISGRWALTPRGRIRAERFIVATHFPFINTHGAYFLKMYQHRSYVLALEGAQAAGGMYVDEAQDGLSFRDSHGLLLLGGGGARTGKHSGGWELLCATARDYWPDARERYRWAAQDCLTLDGAPYIGQYAPRTPRLLVATGFGKWGMSSSMVAAMLLSDMVRGIKNPYAPAFSPQRSILRPQLAANAAEAAASLITPTAPRCPHMGCALRWNPQERSWDCSCHGSRFDEDGTLINDPAQRGLKK